MIHTVKIFSVGSEVEVDVFLEFSCFSMIHWILAIWSLVPLPFLNLVCIYGSSWFTYSWSLTWRILSITFSSVQFSLSVVSDSATPWIAACQASLSNTNSPTPPKPTSIESVMPSSHLILCHPLLLLPPSPPSIRVFSNEWTLRMRWPKYWSFSFSISPSKEHPRLISSMWNECNVR